MITEGPALEPLLRRLAETPPDFLLDPARAKRAGVHTAAVVNDLLGAYGATFVDSRLAELEPTGKQHDDNRLRLALLAAWLLGDESLRARRLDPAAVLTAILGLSSELAELVPAAKAAASSERREELVRAVLARLSLRPAGESEAFARDRLTALSAAERARVLAAARAAEQRARAIREALAKKAAEESADKWSRE